MKSTPTLPDGYREILSVDLQKNKRLALLINGLALLIAAIMALTYIIFGPSLEVYLIADSSDRGWALNLPLVLASLLITGVGTLVYIILHEATHGVFMYGFSKVKPRFGMTLMYAYAGSDAYFGKLPYIVIALAPVAFLGGVLLALNILLPIEYFLPVYFIQIMNISGASGDFYVTARFASLPKDILVRDTGVSMTVYSSKD
jgi:hypothetical protein